MPIHTRTNQYRGVNAHLHSHFQSKGGWKSFHNNHIGDLAKTIAALLPPGYTVDIEQSLQIEIDGYLERPEPDATICEREPRPPVIPSSDRMTHTATLTLPIADTLLIEEERYRNAVVIYRMEGGILGKPVTRLELLSPSNKIGRGREQYIEKREFALRGGLPLVELDYLHETPPPIRGIPRYRQHEPEAHPYVIIVSDPRPSLAEGKTLVYGFDVDMPIPAVNIPLADEDTLLLDFQAVYNQTFESLPAYGQRVDYAQLPDRFEMYSEADQTRIHLCLQRIQSPSDMERL
jgi:hypothetical protein